VIDLLDKLSADDLEILAREVRAGRLSNPYTAPAVARYLGADGPLTEKVAFELERLAGEGMKPAHLALLLDLLVAERRRPPRVEDMIDLVSTGPEAGELASRDTSVVVRELFSSAREHVLVVGFAVYNGREVFAALARRMEEPPDLHVTMCLDVQRPQGDTSSPSEVVARFATRFRAREWPGKRLPAVYYDPRSLEVDSARRASLHAKCVVVDREVAFVSSANFTEAAQVRNIEVGVLIRSAPFAKRLAQHFEALVEGGVLKKVPRV